MFSFSKIRRTPQVLLSRLSIKQVMLLPNVLVKRLAPLKMLIQLKNT